MSVPAYIVKMVETSIASLPANHQARVMAALRNGPRITTLELAHACKVHRVTIWAWVKTGKIPTPRKDSKWRRSWDYSEVAHVMN